MLLGSKWPIPGGGGGGGSPVLHRHIHQGSHRLEKYLNKQGCLEKSLKIKFALKSTGKTIKGLEKS